MDKQKYLVVSEDFGSFKKGQYKHEDLVSKKRIPEVSRMVAAGKAKWKLLDAKDLKELEGQK